MNRVSSRAAVRWYARSLAAVVVVTLGFVTPGIADSTEPSAMRVVVGSGPVSGSYGIAQAKLLCVSTAEGIAASFKYFDVPDKNKPGVNMRVHDAKTMSEAQIVVDNPTDRGTKRGSLELTFGNRNEHPVKYLVFVPGGGTLVQTQAGSGVALAFKGRTKDGIAIDATATCKEVMKL